MNPKHLFPPAVIPFLFAFYLYALYEIILLKLRPISLAFLWGQLKLSLRHPHLISIQLQEGNLIPFKEISRAVHVLSRHGFINLFGNIAIFLPFGLFIGIMSQNKKLSFTGAFLCSLGLSLCLESAQAVCAIGIFDVDDLLLNAMGGLMGFSISALYMQIHRFSGNHKAESCS